MHAKAPDRLRIIIIGITVLFCLLLQALLMIAIYCVDGVPSGKLLQQLQSSLHLGRIGTRQKIPADQHGFRILAADLLQQPFIPFSITFIVKITQKYDRKRLFRSPDAHPRCPQLIPRHFKI